MDTTNLIERCLRHERAAQKELVVQFGGYMMTICRRYIKDAHYCEDVCQNAFINVFRKLYQYDVSKGKLKSWVCKITINCALEYLRSKKMLFDELNPSIESKVMTKIPMDNFFQEDLLLMMNCLSTIQRTIFNLVEIEGYKFVEVSEMLEMKQSTCRSHLHRAKKMLSLKLQSRRDEAI